MKLTILTIIDILHKFETLLGVHRRLVNYNSVFKLFAIIHTIVMLFFTAIGFSMLILHFTNVTPDGNELSVWILFFIIQNTETFAVLVLGMWSSSEYVELLNKLKKLWLLFEGEENISNYTIYFIIGVIFYVIVIGGDILLTILGAYYSDDFVTTLLTDAIISFPWYIAYSTHFSQVIISSLIYTMTTDLTICFNKKLLYFTELGNVVPYSIFNLNSKGSLKLHVTWALYNEIIICCTISNRIFGLQVSKYIKNIKLCIQDIMINFTIIVYISSFMC